MVPAARQADGEKVLNLREALAWHEHGGTDDLGTARHAEIWHVTDLARHGT